MPQTAVTDHIPSLRRYARALTGDSWAADDLVQDTLERACSRWRLWLAGTDLRAWLFTLMHNLFISQVRQVQRQSPSGGSVPLEDVAATVPAPTAPAGLALDLQRCLLRLPPDQRATLLLVALEEMPYSDVARVTGVPVGTVMSRVARARERMRALMDAPAGTAPGTPDSISSPQLRRLK